MARLFERRAKLLIALPVGDSLTRYRTNVVEIEDLRLQFKVTKTLRKEPNKAEISITNLAERTRAELQDKAFRVTLVAGYKDTAAVVFVGDTRAAQSRRSGADWVTTIEAGDGERGYQYARVNESFREGTSVLAIVRKLADKLGVDASQVHRFADLAGLQYVSGYAARGRAARELDRILRGYGYVWSIQDGRLIVAKPDALGFETAVELTPESGLIESPEMATPEKKGGKPVLKARSLLQPRILPGGRIVVRAESHDGTYKVKRVEHSGDTAGGEFFSEIEAEVT